MSQVIRMFLIQCVNTGKLPFTPPQAKMANKETLESFRQLGMPQSYRCA